MKKTVLTGLFLMSLVSFGEEIVVYGPESMKWIETSAGVLFKEKTGTTIKYVPIDGYGYRFGCNNNYEYRTMKSHV